MMQNSNCNKINIYNHKKKSPWLDFTIWQLNITQNNNSQVAGEKGIRVTCFMQLHFVVLRWRSQ